MARDPGVVAQERDTGVVEVDQREEHRHHAEADRGDEHSDDLVSISVRPAGTPCSPLSKRHTFPGKELAALVAVHLPE